MKKIGLLLVCMFTLFSCDDGDLTLEEIEIPSDADVQACSTNAGVTLVFTISGAETVLLEIPDNLLINEATPFEDQMDEEGNTISVPVPRTAAIGTAATSIYRSFNSSITSGYYCDQLPSDVGITLEYNAISGEVQVTSTAITDENDNITQYQHDINIASAVFTGDNGQDIRYNLFVFGSFRTDVPE